MILNGYFLLDLDVIDVGITPLFDLRLSVSFSVSNVAQPAKLADRVGLLPLRAWSYSQRSTLLAHCRQTAYIHGSLMIQSLSSCSNTLG